MREKKELASRLLALAAAGAMALGTVGCGAAEPQEEAEIAEPQAIEVETTTAVYDTIDRQTEFVGRLEAASSTKVYPSSAGKVLKVYAVPGEYVEAGDLLFELDTEDLQTAAETARLQYESALSAADTSIISAKQNYDTLGDAWDTARDAEDSAEDAYDAAKAALNNAQSVVAQAQAAYNTDGAAGNTLQDAIDTAQAALDQAQQGGDQAAIDVAQAALDQANAVFESMGRPSTNQAWLDSANANLNSAQSAFNTASSYLSTAEDSADSARKRMITARDTYYNTKGNEDKGITGTVQTQVDLAKISYDNALKALNEAKVYAPVSGIISAKNVGESDMVSATTPAYVIDQEGEAPMVSFNLSQDGAEALSVGDPVTVTYNGQEYSASITEIAGSADPTSGLYAAKAQTDESLGTSRSGGVVKVKASTAKAEDALVISLDLVEYDGNQPYVYVYRDGKAVRTDLVTGISSAEEVVVLEGLTPEDQIITTWHPDLKDGAAVTLKQQEGE
jgi:RND family efflux transporter MFP subunit